MCYKFQLSITLGRISINSTQVTWVQDLTLWMILIQKKLSISPNCFIALKFISLAMFSFLMILLMLLLKRPFGWNSPEQLMNKLFVGVLLLLVCTPLGFVKLFTLVAELVTRQQFLSDLTEEYQTALMEEAAVKKKVEVSR